MTDTVTLVFPRNPRYYGVARLVVGGLAAGLSLSYDALDDLQLAIGSVLDNEQLPAEGELTVRLEVGEDRLSASIGSFIKGSVDQIVSAKQAKTNGSEELNLRTMLDAIVDDVSVRSDDDGDWIMLVKRVKALA